MPDNITHDSDGASATSQPGSWMIYGAAGYTGALIARHARERGHRPVLAGRSAPAVAALAEQLGLRHRAATLDDQAALTAALDGVDLVLNAAGPFLHTAAPLAEACLRAGAHYLDIGNELQAFRALYDLDRRARQAEVRRAIQKREHALRRMDPPGRPPPAVATWLGNHHDHLPGRTPPGRRNDRSMAASRRVLRFHRRRQHPGRRGNTHPFRIRSRQPCRGVWRGLRPHQPRHYPAPGRSPPHSGFCAGRLRFPAWRPAR
jgi:hypothetical protein